MQQMDWIDTQNVISWDGRSKRQRRASPKTYWEEFVETDDWYQQELLGDVPPEELQAACFDSDVDDTESDSIIGEEEEDVAYSEVASEDASESDTESIISAATEAVEIVVHVTDDDDDDEVISSDEGEPTGEGSDGESEGGSVPQTRFDPVD